MTTLQEMIARWDSGEGKPYKGKLIDWNAYDGYGDEPPSDIGCMCAQGQTLHLLGGWTPKKLQTTGQREADIEAAKLLNISVAHSVLLRIINDSVDGAPSVVLTHPEKILGDQANIILAFWRHLDGMNPNDWQKISAAGYAAWDAAGYAAWDAAEAAAETAARDAAGVAAWDAAGAAARATNEIQGAHIMRERGQAFFFLPMFGFASPEDIPLS